MVLAKRTEVAHACGLVPTPEAILKPISAAQLGAVYVLTGTEKLLMRRAVMHLRRAATEQDATGLNADVFEGKGLSAATVVNTAHTLPMMADKRFIWVRDVDAMGAEEQTSLAAYLDEPNESTCMVLTAAKLDGRGKLSKAAKRHNMVTEFKPLRGRSLRQFLQAEVEQLGHSIAPRAADALLAATGEDVSLLNDAVERLSLFVGAGQRIDEQAVQTCISPVRVETIWKLVDALGMRDARTALGAAESLLAAREPPLRVLAMVTRQLRIIAKMRQALAAGESPETAARSAGAPPFKAPQLARSARQFDMATLGAAFGVLYEADLALKGSKRSADAILQDAFARLCA